MANPLTIIMNLTNKKYVYLTNRGNDAIKQALSHFKNKTILIQDQGGWLTYKKYTKKYMELKTNNTLINLKQLNQHKNQVLLLNSLSGYFTEQPMDKIVKACKNNNITLINDTSGSLGTDLARKGDIIIGSFGKWKPVDLGYGGFIATNKDLEFHDTFDRSKLTELKFKLNNLQKRLKYLYAISSKVKKDLSGYNILNKPHKSLVVIVEYTIEKQKSEIIKYCKKNSLEYTECPRYIRVNKKAISIEVKRK